MAYFERAAHNPDYANRALAFENLGDASTKTGNHERALEAYQSALGYAPKRWLLLIKLARTSFYLAQYDIALVHVQRYMDELNKRQVKPSRSDLELGISVATVNKKWLLVDQYRDMLNE